MCPRFKLGVGDSEHLSQFLHLQHRVISVVEVSCAAKLPAAAAVRGPAVARPPVFGRHEEDMADGLT